ncbi:dsDNA nuclease domain-containing protein [Tenacibaculum maritimum]|uniref:dsDNA nuclease domain-containing protein n=5 Tax=Tenacibaculum maritimum TaxID=107401 RepID=UPI003876EC09
MDLKEKLKTIKPRENAGSTASNRFDYQKNWAICKLIELSKSNSDFLLAFEFHDDIILFNSSSNPSSIDFFQVKTKKTGKHTLNSLLKIPRKSKNSILGKLLTNKINFDSETSSLNIISNSHFNFKPLSKAKICCNELTDTEKTKIQSSLTSELGVKWLNDFLDIIFFDTSDLSIEHHGELAKSRLSDFIENKYSTDIKFNPSLAYRTIFDEVNRRNNIEKEVVTFDEVIQYKAISKEDFELMLKRVTIEPDILTKIKDKIFHALDATGIAISHRKKLTSAWKDMEIEYLKIDNAFFKKCTSIVQKTIDDNLDALNKDVLKSTNFILDKISKNKVIGTQKLYSKHFLEVLILKELYDE